MPAPKPVEWDLNAERELWADICRESFWWFLNIAWGAYFYMEDNPSDRWLTVRVHKPICEWFENHVKEWERNRGAGIKERKKLAIIIPRNFGKTVTFTKSGSLWEHVRNPNLSSYIGSEVLTKAMDFLRPIKTVMSGDDPYARFAWLYGNWYSPDRVWTHGTVVHSARSTTGRSEPSFGTWGVEGGITGAHPDWGSLDDPLSEEKIKESGNWLTTVNQSVAALRPAFRTDSFFMLSLTRYRDNDVAGTYLKLEGVASWNGHPCTNSDLEPRDGGSWHVWFLQAYNSDGTATLPEVWPLKQLKEYEHDHPAEFAAQMMNEPGSGEHMELTIEQIAQLWVNKEHVPDHLTLTLHLDTAFKTNKTRGSGDESVFELWGHDPRGNGDVYYLEGYGNNRWRMEEYIDEIIKLVQRLKSQGKRLRLITDDKEMGGKTGSWENALISNFHGSGLKLPRFIPLARQGTQKIVRMREAANFWVDGHVRLVRGAPGAEKLVHQMVRLGVSAHDDWADAAADVFADEVYKPMLLGRSVKSNDKNVPLQPGDDVLRPGLTKDEARQIYDYHLKEWVKFQFESDDYQ
jgi:hypothetical protein